MRDLKALVEELATNKAWARPGYDGKAARSIESSVKLGDHKDGESTVELELTVSHWKESKEYRAGLQITSVKQDGIFTSRAYGLFNPTTSGSLDRVKSDRYSAKALEAFWELQIHKLREDPEILAKLNLDHMQVDGVEDSEA